MRIDVSEAELCGCDTCVQHRTLLCTQETEPSNVILTSVPVSSGPVQPLLGSTSDQSSGTETPLAPPPPPVSTSVNPEPAQSVDAHADASATPTSSPLQTSLPAIFSFPPPVSSELAHAPTGGSVFGCSSPSGPSISSSSRQANIFGSSGASAASTPSISGPTQAPPTFASYASTASFEAPSPLRWGSVQAPVQANTSKTASSASAFPPPFSYPGGSVPSGFCGQDYFSSRTNPKNPFPGFSVNYLPRCPSSLFGPNPQTTTTTITGRGSFLTGVGTEQGSRYPRYAPTPDLDYSGGQGKMIISISASNSHRHKSHEELRWEDYKNGDKGGFGWFPPAHTPSLFAPPSISDYPPHRKALGPTHRNMTSFPIAPTDVQRPHGLAGVSSPASGCTACGATSSSSPSGHLGFNTTTNPPSHATSLPGLFFSTTYGSFPLLFGTPAYGTTTTPAVHVYAMMILGTNFTSQGTTTTTPAVQAYPMMFGTPNLAGQGTTTDPASQPYPTMFGTPNIAAQGTTTTPAAQPYAMVFGTPNLGAQGIAPAAQAYPTMFGTPNLGAQGIAPAAQAYPVHHGLTLLPFAAMSLQ